MPPSGSKRRPVPRALISVSDKTGIEGLAGALHGAGVEIVSTGGTARLIGEAGIPVTQVSELTGFPEIMDGRVKTLHPAVHGGLLGRPGTDDEVMAEHGIGAIGLLVVNLYPFEDTVARADCTLDEAVEQIDIGGPAMLRAAAKNYRHVSVLTNPSQYDDYLKALKRGGPDESMRFRLAAAAFSHVARYDAAIGNYLSSLDESGARGEYPGQANACFVKAAELRYGENPHQSAAFYRTLQPPPGTLATYRQHQGKPLSFNNLADGDTAWECVRRFDTPACVIVKHANPCGVAAAGDPLAAYEGAFACDPSSAFGGIIAFNGPLDGETAGAILDRQFVEVIIAPSFAPEALKALRARPNVRLLEVPAGAGHDRHDFRRIGGGLLVQSADTDIAGKDELKVAGRRKPDESELADLMFAWRVVKFVKSNAIVCARGGRTLGIGTGQTSRVMSVRLAGWKAAEAGLSLDGAVLASDAFFPFRDGIDSAAELGVRAVIQPAGSIRDGEIVQAADEHGMALLFAPHRHFRH